MSISRPGLRLPPLACAVVLFAGSACSREVPPSPPDLCYRAFPASEEGVTGAVTTADLRALVLGRDPSSTAIAAADCAGRPITTPPPGPACPTSSAEAASPVPVTDERVIERTVSSVETLVWVRTHDLGGGESLGPVALVERRPEGLAVRVMGILRSGSARPSLRVERIRDLDLLVAEADVCDGVSGPGDENEGSAGEAQAASCVRASTILLRDASLFEPTHLVDSRGACLGPAVLELSRSVERPLATGWSRRFSLNASVEPVDGALVVHEQVTVFESDPRSPDVPPRRVRVVDGERTLRPFGGRMLVERDALLARILEDDGSMREATASAEP